MRKKFRIFATLTSMVLVLIVMSVGIWAATQATVTSTGGSLTFTAGSEVYATVELDQDYTGSSFAADDSVVFGATDLAKDSDTLTLANYNFNEKEEYIFVLKITNNNPDSVDLNVTLTLVEEDDANKFDVAVSTDDSSYDPYSEGKNYSIAHGANQMVYVKLSMSDKTASASGNISFSINLTNGASQ